MLFFLNIHVRNIRIITCIPLSINTDSNSTSLCLLLLSGDVALNPGPSEQFKLGFTNIRSLKNKYSSVHHFLCAKKVDIFGISETWLREDETTSFLSEVTPHGFNLFHKPRAGRRGGGVCFFVDKEIKTIDITPERTFNTFEQITLKVHLPRCSLNIACIYRPPGTDSIFLTEFSDYLSHLCSLREEFIIVGDINIDQNTHSLACRYNTVLEDFQLKQHVDFLTHIQGRIWIILSPVNHLVF